MKKSILTLSFIFLGVAAFAGDKCGKKCRLKTMTKVSVFQPALAAFTQSSFYGSRAKIFGAAIQQEFAVCRLVSASLGYNYQYYDSEVGVKRTFDPAPNMGDPTSIMGRSDRHLFNFSVNAYLLRGKEYFEGWYAGPDFIFMRTDYATHQEGFVSRATKDNFTWGLRTGYQRSICSRFYADVNVGYYLAKDNIQISPVQAFPSRLNADLCIGFRIK